MTVSRRNRQHNDDTDELLDAVTGTEQAPADPVFDDKPIAVLLAEQLAGEFRHATGLGWMKWDGKRWCQAPDKDIIEYAGNWAQGNFNAAADEWQLAVSQRQKGAAAKLEENVKGWKKFLARTRLDSVVYLARGASGVSTDPAKFDACHDLLNTQSGVVDLSTGELQPHDQSLLLTKITRAAYEPGAEHADWKQALEAVPDDVRDWYQVRLGQAITGYIPPDDIMLVQQGEGENGKSTVMTAVERVLGEYFLTVSQKALLADNRAHTTELADFRGARFAVVEELPEGRHMNVARLKALVGNHKMTARKLFQDNVAWEATHTLLVNTNYKPSVAETDHGTWRRFALVKFPYRFTGGEPEFENDRHGDEGLRQRLRNGDEGRAEAVLAWLITGAAEWYASGRVMPPLPARVADDTRAWREDSDVLYQFLTEEIEADDSSHILAEDLYAMVKHRLQTTGHREWTNETIVARLEGHEATRELHMEKRRIHAKDGRSYPPEVFLEEAPQSPKQYTAWLGVKFTRGQSKKARIRSERDVVTHIESRRTVKRRTP